MSMPDAAPGQVAGSRPLGDRLNVMALVGLAASLLTAVVMLPHLTQVGGFGMFLSDLVAHGWTLALATIAVGAIRTMSWQALLGAGLTGFLAVPALARLVGDPAVAEFGIRIRVVGGWIPLTEELFKAVPILLLLLLAMRRKDARPSVGDVVLLGLYVGTGFALYEDALYGRGNPDLGAVPVLSLIFPNLVHWETGATSYLGVGHPVFTGVLALGLGVAILYRRRHKLAWLAAPVGVLLAIGQHAVGNTLLALGEKTVWPVTAASYLSVKGWLGPLLLILGTAVIVWLEWRYALRRPRPDPTARRARMANPLDVLRRAVWLPPSIAAQRSQRLAVLQAPPAPLNPQPAPAGQPGGLPPAGQESGQ